MVIARHWPLLAALGAAGCVPYDPPYRAERSYAPPLYAAPTYAAPAYPPSYPALPPLPPAPPVAVEPVEPAPPRADVPDPFEPRLEPPGTPPEPARADAPAPSSQDPVTDLLLTPLPQRDAASPVPVKPPAAAGQDPFMGFRPMRGQTRPTP